jgi:hypothetical protein
MMRDDQTLQIIARLDETPAVRPAFRNALRAGLHHNLGFAEAATGGCVADAAALVGVRPSTAKRHLADLRARSGLSTEQLIYRGRADGWLVVGELEPSSDREDPAAL